MIITTLTLFALTSILGIILISFVLQSKNTPKGLAFIHGTLGAISIILLIIYAFFKGPSLIISIIVFVMAALMGFILILRDILNKSIPKWLALLHGITAVIGFVLLLLLTFIF